MRNYLASFVNLLHIGVVMVSMTGWAWWPDQSLVWYVLLMVGIGMQWYVSGNRCILTDLEWWLKHNVRWQPGTAEGFITAWSKRFGFNWSPKTDRLVPWLGLSFGLLLGCSRLVLT